MDDRQRKSIIKVAFFTIFMDMLGVGILIPIFPSLVVVDSPFKIIPDAWSQASGFILIGWLIGIFSIFQFVFSPILGQLSDRYGRKKILALSILGTAFSYVIFAIGITTKNIPLMFIARILDGITGGNISVTQAVISDVSHAKDRAKNFGLIGIAIGLGFIFGPVIGGKLSSPNIVSWFNLATPFWFTAILSGINFILILINLPESLKVRQTKAIEFKRALNNIKFALGNVKLNSVVIPVFLFNIGFSFYSAFWAMVLLDKFGLNQSQIGDFFALSGIIIILSQGVVVRRLSGRVADYKVLRVSILVVGLSILLAYLIPYNHVSWIYLVIPPIAIGAASTRAFNGALLARISDENDRGRIIGINSSTMALSQAIAAVLAGYIAVEHAALPILTGAVVAIVGGILFNLWSKNLVENTTSE